MHDITRYEPYLDYPRSYNEPELGIEPCENGDFVKYEDHLEIVKFLQEEVEDLKLFAQSELSRGATYGQKVGYKIGYDNAVLKFSTKH